MIKKLLFFLIPIISIVLLFSFYYKGEVREEKLKNIKDQLTLTLKVQLRQNKMNDLEQALIISKNSSLVDALENDDEDLGYKLLSDITTSVKHHTGNKLRAQIITNELNIFARSWDDIYAGMPIGYFRNDLEYFKTHSKPRASIEVGRRLGIKVTVPLYKKENFLGLIEVISFFESMTSTFSSMGIDLYVLLHDDYMKTAVLMEDNVVVQNYVLANRDYNYTHLQTLESVDLKALRLGEILDVEDKYIFSETMKDGQGTIIGMFVFVLPKKYFNYFRDSDDDISYLINLTRSHLYQIEKQKHYDENIYDAHSIDSFLYLQDVIEKEDRELFFNEAYEKYDKYTKDELIQMMLNRKIVKKIDGKIK